jgi:hypothetical protein
MMFQALTKIDITLFCPKRLGLRIPFSVNPFFGKRPRIPTLCPKSEQSNTT